MREKAGLGISECFAWFIVGLVASPTEVENAGGVSRLEKRMMSSIRASKV